jgi:hypothetical protein
MAFRYLLEFDTAKRGDGMTQTQALTQALILALIAPNDEKATQASDLAESIAQGLNSDQVEQCKLDALEIIGENP